MSFIAHYVMSRGNMFFFFISFPLSHWKLPFHFQCCTRHNSTIFWTSCIAVSSLEPKGRLSATHSVQRNSLDFWLYFLFAFILPTLHFCGAIFRTFSFLFSYCLFFISVAVSSATQCSHKLGKLLQHNCWGRHCLGNFISCLAGGQPENELHEKRKCKEKAKRKKYL